MSEKTVLNANSKNTLHSSQAVKRRRSGRANDTGFPVKNLQYKRRREKEKTHGNSLSRGLRQNVPPRPKKAGQMEQQVAHFRQNELSRQKFTVFWSSWRVCVTGIDAVRKVETMGQTENLSLGTVLEGATIYRIHPLSWHYSLRGRCKQSRESAIAGSFRSCGVLKKQEGWSNQWG